MADTIFSTLSHASYDGIIFPLLRHTIKTGSAAAFHKFPYRAGVIVEYTGREPTSGSLEVPLFTGLYNFPVKDLWPGTMSKLRERAQEQRSGELVIPTLGALPKAFIRLDEAYDPQRKDGTMLQIEFIEDSMDRFIAQLAKSSYGIAENAALAADTALAVLGYKASLNELEGTGKVDFATSLASLKFAIQQANEKISAPIQQLAMITERCDELVETVISLGDPENWEVRRSIANLKNSVTDLSASLANTKPIAGFMTTAMTCAAQIASEKNGTVEEILALNTIADANAIPPGELILFVQR